jgi:hypothetical protein
VCWGVGCACVCVCGGGCVWGGVSVGGFEQSVDGLYRLRLVCTAPYRETYPEVFGWNSFARRSVANTDCIGNHANFTVNVTVP